MFEVGSARRVTVIDAVAVETSTTSFVVSQVGKNIRIMEISENKSSSLYLKLSLSFVKYMNTIFCTKMRKIDLQDKIVLITGACSTIGEALAQNFYEQGCILILIGNEPDQLENIKISLLSRKTDILTHTPITMLLNLTELDNIQAHVKNIIDSHGHIDILINNANVHFVGEVINTALCTDMELMNTNYFSQIALTKAVLNYMFHNASGHIIFISSSQGICTDPLHSAFGASQHALLMFANTLREEIQEKNIKVITICVPTTKTNISQEIHAVNSVPNTAATEVVKAIKHEKSNVVVEPFYRRISFYIKELYPNLHFTLFRSKF